MFICHTTTRSREEKKAPSGRQEWQGEGSPKSVIYTIAIVIVTVETVVAVREKRERSPFVAEVLLETY